MSAYVNDRDVLLANAPVRVLNVASASIYLSSSALAFFQKKDGGHTPDVIAIQANLVLADGPITFSATNCTLSNITANSCTVEYSTVTGSSCVVTATAANAGSPISSSVLIGVVADGSDGTAGGNAIVGFLTNEAATLAATTDGNVGSFTTAGGTFRLIEGTSDVTGASGVTYSVASQNNCSVSITAGGVYSVSAMIADSASAVLQAVYKGITIQKTLTLAKSRAGANGVASFVDISSTAQVFTRANVSSSFAPSNITLTATPYGGAATYQWQYWNGSSWVNVPTAGTASTYTVQAGDFTDARTYRVQATIAGSVYGDEITLVQVTGGKDGGSGSRGVGTWYGTANSWNDAIAVAACPLGVAMAGDVVTLSNGTTYVGTKKYDGSAWYPLGVVVDGGLVVPGSITANQINSNGLTIRDTNGGIILDASIPLAAQVRANPNLCPAPKGFATFANGANAGRNGDGRFGDGSFLFLPVPSVNNTYVAAESPPLGIPANAWYTVSFDAYQDNGATGAVLNVDTVTKTGWDSTGKQVFLTNTLTRYSFTEQMINDATAPNAYLRLWAPQNNRTYVVVANIKVELGTTVTPWTDNIITPDNASVRIKSASIGTAQIANGAITNALISNATILTANIKDGQITYAKIGDGEIGNAKIGTAAITDVKIQDGAITNAKIGYLAVTETKILDGSITNGKIGYASIDTLKLQGQTVTIPVSAYNGGGSGSGNLSVISAGISSSGAPIVITFSCLITFVSGGRDGVLTWVYIRRDGNVIASIPVNQAGIPNMPFAFTMQDTTSAAWHSYDAYVTNVSTVSNASMVLLETKR